MNYAFRFLLALINFVPSIVEYFRERRLRKEARQAAEAAIIKENAPRERKAAEIVAERRDPDDVVERLRDGRF